MADRVDKLSQNFVKCIEKFDKESIFTGPSLYFHFRTLEKLSTKGLQGIFEDEQFFEYLYATLTSWGLHRMGPTSTKLVDFKDFCSSLRFKKDSIIALQELRLSQLPSTDIDSVRDKLWDILSDLRISRSETQLVAGSKALHHFLPSLMPPIDRQYTLEFFYNSKNPYDNNEQIFKTIYPFYNRIALNNRSIIVGTIGKGFHTGETKVIDNAIVGFVLDKLS